MGGLDFVAPCAFGLGDVLEILLRRTWGRPTEVSWGMIFPHVDDLARHPSHLYELALEGSQFYSSLFGGFHLSKGREWLCLYLPFSTVFLDFIEFSGFDLQIGFLFFDWLTMGQLLSLPMVFRLIVGSLGIS